ncbi:tetratricopeptide repeat protein [Spirosoma areae]
MQSSLAFSQTIGQLKQQLQTARHDTTRLRLYSELIKLHADQDQNDSAYVYVQKMLPLATRLNHTYYLGRYHHSLGLYYRKKGLLTQSLGELQQALSLYQRVNDTVRYGRALYDLSKVYTDKGDTRQAIAQSFSNLRYYEHHRDSMNILNTYSLLQAIYTRSKNTKLRQYYTNQFIQLADKLPERKLYNKCSGYDMLAVLYEDQQQYDRAWPYRKQIVRMARQLNNSNLLVEMLSYAAANLRQRNQAKAALPYLYEALSLSNRFSEDAIMNLTWKELSQAELQLGHPQQALAAAQRSLQSVRSSGGRAVDVPSILLNLSLVQEGTGHYREALLNYKEYQRLRDSLYNAEISLKGAQIQAQYNLEKKESTIQLLHKNALLQQQQFVVVNQQRLLYGLGAGFLLLVVAGTAYFLRQARVTQQKLVRQNQEIETQSTRLKEANALKDRLFSIIGHDLRGPVASLQTSVNQLRSNDSQPMNLDLLDQEVSRLAYTLDNLLYWSLTQRQGLRVHRHLVDLTDLVKETLEGFQGLIRFKNIAVSVEEGRASIHLDENLTMLVLRNMLHNAIKFTPAGGAIRLSIRQEPTLTHLLIADTGVGMNVASPAQPNQRNGQGTGLGLVLSQELMKQVGGELRLDSQPGQGTTVRLSWPSGQHQPGSSPDEPVPISETNATTDV